MDRTKEQSSTSLLSSGSTTPSHTNVFFATEKLDRSQDETLLQLVDGTVLRIPTALLLNELSAEESTGATRLSSESDIIVPVIEEQLTVSKRTIVTGTVHLDRRVSEHQQTLSESLLTQTYTVERVAMDQPIAAIPPVRDEGATTIYPVTEERLIVATQLFLKEEVRVTRQTTERRDTQTFTLKREDVSVTRIPADKPHVDEGESR